jgi:hypothetical protein
LTSTISSTTELVLALDGAEDDVLVILADHRLVGRDREHVRAVDLLELLLLGLGRAGHAGDLVVELEEVLVRDRGERLVLALDLHAFLRLDRLVQSLAEAPPGHEPPGELVDDDDLAVLVLHVLLVELVVLARAQRLAQHVAELHVGGAEDVLDAQRLLGLGDPLLGEVDVLRLVLGRVVARGRLASSPGLAASRVGAASFAMTVVLVGGERRPVRR